MFFIFFGSITPGVLIFVTLYCFFGYHFSYLSNHGDFKHLYYLLQRGSKTPGEKQKKRACIVASSPPLQQGHTDEKSAQFEPKHNVLTPLV